MGLLSSAKSTGNIIFRKIRGRIVPISARRIQQTSRKAQRHYAGASKEVLKRSLANKKLKGIKRARVARNVKRAAIGAAAFGTFATGTYLGYREAKTTYPR